MEYRAVAVATSELVRVHTFLASLGVFHTQPMKLFFEIVAQLPAKNPDAGAMLDRMLRVLAGYKVLSCSNRIIPNGQVERLYGLAPVSQFFTKSEDGASLAALSLLFQDKVLMEPW